VTKTTSGDAVRKSVVFAFWYNMFRLLPINGHGMKKIVNFHLVKIHSHPEKKGLYDVPPKIVLSQADRLVRLCCWADSDGLFTAWQCGHLLVLTVVSLLQESTDIHYLDSIIVC
jgi:hypothetical protein